MRASPDLSLPILRMVPQRFGGDCAICALAMYLGRAYEDVLAAAVWAQRSRTRPPQHAGLYRRQITATAKALGAPLVAARTWDLDTTTGILHLEHRAGAHVVVLAEGLIFDPDGGVVWSPDVYLLSQDAKPTHVYVRR